MGNFQDVLVKVPAHLSCTGQVERKVKKIDSCITDIVRALQEGGIDMCASCCGHGKALGTIQLVDGRILIILGGKNEMAQARTE